MRVNFYDILSSHASAYPKMRAEDYACLAYDSEFGNGSISDENAVISALMSDLEGTKTDALEPFTVDIGGGFSRLNLAPTKQFFSAYDYLFLMKKTPSQGTERGYNRKLSLISRSAKMKLIPETGADAEVFVGQKPTHSSIYKRFYGASYRIISSELAPLIPALCLISEALGKSGKVSVGIDGREGSGKTYAANLIREMFSSYNVTVTAGLYTLKDPSKYDVKLFMNTDNDTRHLRLLERGGEAAYEEYKEKIMPDEERYFSEYSPWISSDLTITT